MKKITVSILTTLLMLSMVFSSSVFAAEKEQSAWDSFLGLFSAKTAATSDVGVEYRGHVQNKGDFPLDGSWIQGPDQLGTVGESLRLEAFWIKLTNEVPAGLHIQYRVHVQNKGWMAPVEDGALAGTQGESLQIESVEIKLVDDAGNPAVGYSVEYRGHIQNKGDMPADGSWYKDGEQLGTVGEFLRLEALEVKIVKEGSDLTAYNQAVAAANALTESDYTADSWAVLETALANVVTSDNTQEEVDAATAAINDAIDALVPVPSVAFTAVNSKDVVVALTAVPSNGELVATFSDEVDADTVNVNTVKIKDADGNLQPITAADLSLDSTDKVLNVELDNLDGDKGDSYTITVNGVKTPAGDAVGTKSAEFTVAEMAVVNQVGKRVDNGVLNYTNNAPAGTNQIVIEYDENLDTSTATASNVSVVDIATGNKLSLTSVTGAQKNITVVLANALTTGKQYKVVVANIKDSVGEAAESYTDIFAVAAAEPAVDTARTIDNTILVADDQDREDPTLWPNIEAGTTQNGTYYAGLKINITMATKLTESSINGNVYLYDVDAEEVVATTLTYNNDAKMITLVPNANLKEDADYEIRFNGALQSSLGIYLDPDNLDEEVDAETIPFSTLSITAPTVVSVTNVNGASELDVDVAQEFIVVTSKEINNFDRILKADLDGNIGVILSSADITDLKAADVVDFTLSEVANAENTYKVRIPAGSLTVNKAYKVVLIGKDNEDDFTAPIADGSGNELVKTNTTAFTTEAADVAAPQFVSVHKGDSLAASTVITSLTNVTDGQVFTFEFNEALKDVDLANKVTLQKYVNGKWSASNDATLAKALSTLKNADGVLCGVKVTLSDVSLEDAKYRIVVGKGAISDIANNVTTKDTTFDFIATDGNDVVDSVSALVPDGGDAGTDPDVDELPATNVNEDTTLTVTFNADANVADFATSNIIVKDAAGTVVTGTIEQDDENDNVYVFTPSADLASGTTYSVEISGVMDMIGNTIDTYKSSFVTGNTADPKVVSTSVVDGQIDVATDVAIDIVFNKDITGIDANTNGTPDYKEIAIGGVASTIDWDSATKTVTVTPNADLTASSFYTLTIPKSLTSGTANMTINFTTGTTQTDTVPPTVDSIEQIAGGKVVVTFDEEMTSSTLTTANIKAFDPDLNSGAGAYITLFAGDLTVNAGKTTVTINSTSLKDNTDYVIVVTTGVKDKAGNALETEVSQALVIDKTAPTVDTAAGTPIAQNGGTDTIVFSEELSADSMTDVEDAISSAVGGIVSTDLGFVWSADGKTLTITNNDVDTDATFAADVTVDISDLVGNTTTGATILEV